MGPAFSSVVFGWLCVCVNDYQCLRNGLILETAQERLSLVLCATDQVQTLFKILSSRPSPELSQQLHFIFLGLNLFGTKLINVIQGVLIPFLHDVILTPLQAPSHHSLR